MFPARGDKGLEISAAGDTFGEGIGLNRGDSMPFPDSATNPGTGDMLCASGDPTRSEGECSLRSFGEPGSKDFGDGANTGLRGGVECDVVGGDMIDSKCIRGLTPGSTEDSVCRASTKIGFNVFRSSNGGVWDPLERKIEGELVGERDLLCRVECAFHGGSGPAVDCVGAPERAADLDSLLGPGLSYAAARESVAVRGWDSSFAEK
jgi:hypothetical protein